MKLRAGIGTALSAFVRSLSGRRHLRMTAERTFTWAYTGRERLWSMALTFRDGKKTSSGLKSQNPRFKSSLRKQLRGFGAKRSGIPFGTYHYIDVRESGVEQAKHFLAAISGYEGTLLPAVDVEETHGLSPEQIVACVAEFLKAVDATLKGKRVLFYTNRSFWNDTMVGRGDFSEHPLRIAQYPKHYRSGMRPAIPQD
jgi:GH25 family lysozyme M1 (1,4-beta-N-acetylmuramidase)